MSASEYCQTLIVEDGVEVFCDEQADPCAHTVAAIRAQAVREYREELIARLRAEAASIVQGGNAYGLSDNPDDYHREGRADAYLEIIDELEAE